MSLQVRAMDFGHKIVASSLILLTVGGLSFCTFGFGDIIYRNRQRRAALKLQKEEENPTSQ